MTDEELAAELVTQITGEDEFVKMEMLLKAFAAIREECAKIAETFPVQTIETVSYRKKIAAAIRQAKEE